MYRGRKYLNTIKRGQVVHIRLTDLIKRLGCAWNPLVGTTQAGDKGNDKSSTDTSDQLIQMAWMYVKSVHGPQPK